MSTTTRRVRRWRNIRSQRRNGPILKAAHEAPWRRATLISRKHGADGMPTGSDRTVLLPSVTSTVAHAAYLNKITLQRAFAWVFQGSHTNFGMSFGTWIRRQPVNIVFGRKDRS
ncbi:hypothetical protein HZH68_007506 [Vespula germanica]|uniref:Uncharacterized protein n=1 Tax=Vespula germanica TaxID=30212 RepID=A0A834KD38_VESGE|nr:hypothetical protein HZH68_007506 [Vespula germanica]